MAIQLTDRVPRGHRSFKGTRGDPINIICTRGRPILVKNSIRANSSSDICNPRNSGDNEMIRLTDLHNDQLAVVVDLQPGSRSTARFLALGFTPGADVKMIQNFGTGPVVALVRDTRVAMGRGEAGGILVWKKEDTNNG